MMSHRAMLKLVANRYYSLNTLATNQVRKFFSLNIGNDDDNDNESSNVDVHSNLKNRLVDVNTYPPGKPNTCFNVCDQGYLMVVETLGKFSRVVQPGWFLAVPLLQKIKYVVDDRELVIDVYKQYAHTLDNVQIGIAAQLYLRITDVEKACYRVRQPLLAVVSHAQSAMRTSVGKYDLDHLLKDRTSINKDVSTALSESENEWGIKINRVEITELTPDANIARAMDLQATAERERRQTEKNADAKKRAMELESEGYRLKLINEAEGRAESLRIETDAQAKSITTLEKTGVSVNNVLRYQVATRYLDKLATLATSGKHTTFFINKDMGDMKAMTSNVLDLLNTPSTTSASLALPATSPSNTSNTSSVNTTSTNDVNQRDQKVDYLNYKPLNTGNSKLVHANMPIYYHNKLSHLEDVKVI